MWMLKFKNKDGEIVMEESVESGNLTIFDKQLKEEIKEKVSKDIADKHIEDEEESSNE